MWCYACGALKTPDSKGRLVWVRPTGRADRNPAASKPEPKLTPRRVALLLRHYALYAQISVSWSTTQVMLSMHLPDGALKLIRESLHYAEPHNDVVRWVMGSDIERRMVLLMIAEAIGSMD